VNIVVDNLLTHYVRSGSSSHPPVLIIPGWADTTASWQPAIKKLANKYDVLAVDLPGFGGKHRTKQPGALPSMLVL
jgi:pimeloyl-ACP methyl ester carboxylesterase